MKNTKHLGTATVFIYPNKDKYIGVCLELDLIDDDHNKEVLADRMNARIQSYVSYIQKKNFDDTFLNRPAPKRYWDKFYQFLNLMKGEEKNYGKMVAPSTKDFSVSRQILACEPV